MTPLPGPKSRVGRMTAVSAQNVARKCFIISPIGAPDSLIREEADAVLRYIIGPALGRIAADGGPVITAVRSDQIGTPGRIEEQMLEAILTYDLCIADLSGLNPNVLYELAIAQCAGRPVVLMCRAGENLPFDVKDYRTIVYDLKPRSIKEDTWVPTVVEHVRAVLTAGYVSPRLLKDDGKVRDGTRSYLLNSQSREFGEAPKYNEVVSQAETLCNLMGISLTSWRLQNSKKVLADLGARGVHTRILIMNPENPALPHLINEDETSTSLRNVKDSTHRMTKYFSDISQNYKSFELRLISKGLPHAQLTITDTTALLIQYMYSRGTPESPLLQIPKGTELYDAVVQEFEVLWQLNQPSSSQASN